MITNDGAKRLISSVLKQAYNDYKDGAQCPEWCPMDECKNKTVDHDFCDAKKFIKSAWAATLCDAVDLDHKNYVEKTIDAGSLTKATFRYIESELYAYKDTQREYNEIRQEIIEAAATMDQSGIRGDQVSDPTFAKATKLLNERRLDRIGKVIKAITRVYDGLSEDSQRLVNLKYWRGYDNHRVCYDMNISMRTFHRWRKTIVYSIGRELGFL